MFQKSKQLLAFKHNGFWACMDTLREKKELNIFGINKKCDGKYGKKFIQKIFKIKEY